MISFIFVEAIDGAGKTTTCDLLVKNIIPRQQFCKASKVVLPNGDGPLGFLRSYVKNKDFHADEFARQLLHCCSHIDAFESLAYGDRISYRGRKYHHYYVFDRGPLSTMVYGQALIKDKMYLEILRDININILQDLVEKEIIDDLVFVYMNKDKPYRTQDDSYYERVVDYSEIRNLYIENFNNLKNSKIAESKRVKFCSVKISEGLSREEVAERIWNSIND